MLGKVFLFRLKLTVNGLPRATWPMAIISGMPVPFEEEHRVVRPHPEARIALTRMISGLLGDTDRVTLVTELVSVTLFSTLDFGSGGVTLQLNTDDVTMLAAALTIAEHQHRASADSEERNRPGSGKWWNDSAS